MTVSVPLVALFALGVFLAYRFMGLRIWHAVVCLLCGFLLAATSAAPSISHALYASSSGRSARDSPPVEKGLMPA